MSAPVRPVVFLDLDDTILQTAGKCPPGARLHAAATGRDGQPLSFMTDAQKALVEWLLATTTVIPVTARNEDAFRRVHLPFAHGAVLNFGGTILDGSGARDLEWHQAIAAVVSPLRETLRALRDDLLAWSDARDLGLRVRVLGDSGLDLYVVVKHPQHDIAAVDAAEEEARRRGIDARLHVHRNGNNLSFIPRAVNKADAVSHLLARRLPADTVPFTLGFGDSLTDAPFLAACDFAVVPKDSQLFHASLAQHVQR